MPIVTPRLRLRLPLPLPRLRKGRSGFAPRAATRDRLSELDGVRDNPGNLRARCYVPEGLAPGAPLVVVLHGCTQDAAVYDHGAGWSTLADRHGFALLFPEQQRANNPMLCFNWFAPEDTKRGSGEAASIAAMVEAMKAAHGVDPQRIFVTGLSAGGAMATAMLAAYPDLFAAGAILAGVAYGCAGGVTEAFDCMGGRAKGDAATLAAKVRRASPHKGPWPRVQVWQGSADTIVVPSNADAIVLQWAALHGLAPQPDRVDDLEGHPRRTWLGPDGAPLVEQVSVTGMAHGVPLDISGTGAGGGGGGGEALGAAGAHMLDVGLSSTQRIAEFFGIAAAAAAGAPKAVRPARGPARPAERKRAVPRPAQPVGVQKVIEDALRKAGLMR